MTWRSCNAARYFYAVLVDRFCTVLAMANLCYATGRQRQPGFSFALSLCLPARISRFGLEFRPVLEFALPGAPSPLWMPNLESLAPGAPRILTSLGRWIRERGSCGP